MNNEIIIKRTITGSHFTYVTNFPYLYVLSEFIDDVGFEKRVLDFLKDDSQEGLPISTHALGKYGNTIAIVPDLPQDDNTEFRIDKNILIKILETLHVFAKEGSPEIILTEENGIYTMESQGKTIAIN